MPDGQIFRWILDVDSLWSCSSSPSNPSERALTKQHWANEQSSQKALNLLPPDEQDKVVRFYFASDAKLSLGSCLLKRKAISETCGVPWSQIVVGHDGNKKPCYKPEGQVGATLEFNVSHHGSLVALVGCVGKSMQLGVDVVKMNFEKDYSMVLKEGFTNWVQTYEAVFSDREMNDIACFMDEAAGGRNTQETVRAQLRHFYAHWGLKEAYVKMTGEALLASWLKELEFRNVQTPLPAAQLDCRGNVWGQTCSEAEIWFHGKRLTDVSLEIRAYRDDYMIATAASSPSVVFPSFEELDLEQDIYRKVAR